MKTGGMVVLSFFAVMISMIVNAALIAGAIWLIVKMLRWLNVLPG